MNIDVQAGVGTTPLDITSLVQIVCHASLTMQMGNPKHPSMDPPEKVLPELCCGMVWRGIATREGKGLCSALCSDKEAQVWRGGRVGNDGMQLGTLLSLYSIGRTLLLLYSVERTHHCIELVLLPGTLESSLPFRQCLPCSPLSSLVSCSSLAVCCAGVCFLPSRCRSRSYHYYAFNTTHMGEAKFTAIHVAVRHLIKYS